MYESCHFFHWTCSTDESGRLGEVYPITSTGFSGGVLDREAALGDEMVGPLGLREDCGAVISAVWPGLCLGCGELCTVDEARSGRVSGMLTCDLPHTWWWFSQSLCWQKDPQYRATLQPLHVSLAFLPQFQQLCKPECNLYIKQRYNSMARTVTHLIMQNEEK